MNSKDWKLSLLALAAVSLLAACSDDKKKEPTSPFAGIWVQQDNLKEYSAHRGELTAQNRRRFCERVEHHADRYGDDQYRMRAVLVQTNGEVYRYTLGDSVSTAGYRERNFIGSVNSAGIFTAGSIGPDGRVVSTWNQSLGPWDLPQQTTLNVQGNVLTIYSENRVLVFERHLKPIVDDYGGHVTRCLVEVRKRRGCGPEYGRRCGPRQRPGVHPEQLPGMDPGMEPMPKDYDPQLDGQDLENPEDQNIDPEYAPEERRPAPRRR